ncbi:ferredoxin-type protein NapF [Ruegeria conchae]|uniref:ferredoxin-type protein NapF n=1 Tax=Ruegeria conchae TaxID=981384 RepID=UPI0021A83FCD|nr:ferredoxin-type protein NapF [Ruegeria conchae]UWR02822.1 ferredoxin-type protein NapF [Ruegeria conchae]
MNKLASRRAFLKGKVLRNDQNSIRPPGADAAEFLELCTQCDECREACPEDIIKFDTQGFPVVQLDASPCTFCGDCANACPTGALNPEHIADWPWRAKVAATCLSMNGVSCRVCQDVCDHRAIRFQLQTGGRAEPVLDTDTCTGCGACASACPAGSVSFERHTPPTQEVAL